MAQRASSRGNGQRGGGKPVAAGSQAGSHLLVGGVEVPANPADSSGDSYQRGETGLAHHFPFPGRRTAPTPSHPLHLWRHGDRRSQVVQTSLAGCACTAIAAAACMGGTLPRHAAQRRTDCRSQTNDRPVPLASRQFFLPSKRMGTVNVQAVDNSMLERNAARGRGRSAHPRSWPMLALQPEGTRPAHVLTPLRK